MRHHCTVHYEEVLGFVDGRFTLVDLCPELLIGLKMVENLQDYIFTE